MEAKPSRVIGYIRVSTDEQELGPDAQREALERWCAAHGAELVSVHSDLAVSGGAPLDQRPALLMALDELDAGAALLVAKRDRLARDVMVSAMVERMADRVGARIVSADGVGNGASPEAMLMRRMVDAFAEYERALIGARTRAALAVKRARGERVGHVPFGFQLAADGVHIEECASERRVISLVLEYQAEGLSLRAIGRRLESLGLRPRSGGRWHPNTVRRVVRGIGARRAA